MAPSWPHSCIIAEVECIPSYLEPNPVLCTKPLSYTQSSCQEDFHVTNLGYYSKQMRNEIPYY